MNVLDLATELNAVPSGDPGEVVKKLIVSFIRISKVVLPGRLPE